MGVMFLMICCCRDFQHSTTDSTWQLRLQHRFVHVKRPNHFSSWKECLSIIQNESKANGAVRRLRLIVELRHLAASTEVRTFANRCACCCWSASLPLLSSPSVR